MTDQATAENRRVLVIGAHPDDPEFGCGATVAKWAAQGDEIHFLILTSGDQGNRDPSVPPGQIAHVREGEQRAAAEVLGVRSVRFLRYPDGMVEANLELRRRLCGLIRHYRPDVVMAIDPWRPYQLHPDHRAAGFGALDAVRGSHSWSMFPEQLNGVEPWRVKEVYLFWSGAPDYWEDVSDYMEQRMEALRCHASQMRDRAEQFAERLRRAAHEAGEALGYEYAEGFKRLITG